jgi:hypothetical protein
MSERNYSRDEVNAILSKALERQQKDVTSHRELIETGREIGLDAATIEAAAREVEGARATAEQERRVRADLRRALFNDAFSYLVVMAFLLAVNLLSSPAYMWVVWPALGWGLGLLFHARAALFPNEKRISKLLARAARRERRGDQTRARIAAETRARVAVPHEEEEIEEEASASEAGAGSATRAAPGVPPATRR